MRRSFHLSAMVLALGFASAGPHAWGQGAAVTSDPLTWTNVAPVQVDVPGLSVLPPSISSVPSVMLPTDPSRTGGRSEIESYQIQIGDEISYRVVEDREEAKTLPVNSAGEVAVPYVGRITAAGKRLSQLREEIKQMLEKELYYQATVVLAMEKITSTVKAKKVYVVGQVRTQGAQEMPSGERLTTSQAVLRAGGLLPFANGRKVQVVRKTPEGRTERLSVDVHSVLKGGNVDEDLELQPEDMVIVPEKMFNL